MAEQATAAPPRMFSELGLDVRVLKAISQLGFVYPTPIQEECIPISLEGRDVLARAPTGSGKTVAYCVPVVSQLLTLFQTDPSQTKVGTKALILVPTRELVAQVHSVVAALSLYAQGEVTCIGLHAEASSNTAEKLQLQGRPHIVVGTPSRVVSYLQSGVLALKQSLSMLVIDEADLVLSYGYRHDVQTILSHLPKIHQSLLLSATLSPEVESLKALVLHEPALVAPKTYSRNDSDMASGPNQVYAYCNEKDKQLLVYALIKLNLIKPKALFFVNSVDACYRLKLFLEHFHIGSAVLNSELPFNSRLHILEQFNRGLFDYLIVTDQSSEVPGEVAAGNEGKKKKKKKGKGKASSRDDDDDDGEEDEDEEEDDDDDNGGDLATSFLGQKKKGQKRKGNQGGRGGGDYRTSQGDFGVARGFDFVGVSTVINMTFPTSVKSYVHRVGRAGRGGHHGDALSLVSPDERPLLRKVVQSQQERSAQKGGRGDAQLRYMEMNMEDIEGFRYRVEDVSRAVTKVAVREARLNEIKNELVNSRRLKAHFEDNPLERDQLKHDKLGRVLTQPHLAVIPAYLQPGVGVDDTREQRKKRRRARRNRGGPADPTQPHTQKAGSVNPLTSFQFRSANNNGTASNNKPILSASRASFRGSTAGRRRWKNKHATGHKKQGGKRKPKRK